MNKLTTFELADEMPDDTPKTYACPLCGTPNQLWGRGDFDTCDVCYWKDDNAELYPYDSDNINNISFAEAKKIWESGKEIPYLN